MFLGSSTPTVLFIQILQVQVIMLGCIVFGCRVLWAGFNSDSLPILRSLSSGRTGKMVKKVCPCNQLCSNYLSFWSFLHPSPLPSLHLLSHASSRSLTSFRFKLWSSARFEFSQWVQFSCFSNILVKNNKGSKNSLRTEMTELTSHYRVKLTVHASASSHTHTRPNTH